MSQRKSYVVKRERELVIRSSIIDTPEFANLKRMLETYERIDDNIIAEDANFDPATIHVIKNTFPSIMQNAVHEWEYVGEKAEKCKCILDNNPISTQYFIRNRMTGEELIIGSECIKQYDFRNGISSTPTAAFIARQQKERRKIIAANEISESYGNVAGIVTAHRRTLDESPLILAREVYNAYCCKIDAIETFCTQYIEGKIPASQLCELEGLLSEADDFSRNHVGKWIARHQDNFFMGTVHDADHLKQAKKLNVLEKIRKDGGRITQETVCHLGYLGFIRKHLKAFQKKLVSVFDTVTIQNDHLHINFCFKPIASLGYTMSPADFMQLFGFVLLEKGIVEFSFGGVYPKCKFVASEDNQLLLLDAVRLATENKYEFLHYCNRFYIRCGNQYCDTLTPSAFATHLIPHIIRHGDPASLDRLYFDRLHWKEFAELDSKARQDLKNAFLAARKKEREAC